MTGETCHQDDNVIILMTREYIKNDHQFPPIHLRLQSLGAKISFHNSIKVGLVVVVFACFRILIFTDFYFEDVFSFSVKSCLTPRP